MNLLNKLTIKNLKLNKKRTIVTVIGIMLSVALITAVASIYSSGIKSLVEYERFQNGDFHVAFYDVPIDQVYKIANNKKVDKINFVKKIGYAKIDSKNDRKPYVFVKGFTKDSLNDLSVKLVSGRLPENEDEIVIPTHLQGNGRVFYEVGDEITLNLGKRISLIDNAELSEDDYFQNDNEAIVDTYEKKYKIVGIIEKPAVNIEVISSPSYTFISFIDSNNLADNVDVYVKFTDAGVKKYYDVISDIVGVQSHGLKKSSSKKILGYTEFIDYMDFTKYKTNINYNLIGLEVDPISASGAGGLGIVVGIVIAIIVFTSIFCIKNSFDISITEKIKQYGMLRSVGATKKQIKNNVFYEATILGLFGIPLGIIFGFIASCILIVISNLYLTDMFEMGFKLQFCFSGLAVLIAVVLGIVTIYFSAFRSAKKASKVSPIDSIKNSANIKIDSKSIKSPKFIKRLFGIGGEISYKNLKRNKKKYRTTVLSLVVSVLVFIALSGFMNLAFSLVNNQFSSFDYNVSLSTTSIDVDDDIKYHKFVDTVNLDNVDDYTILRSVGFELENFKLNQEYADYTNQDVSSSDNSYISVYTVGDEQYKKYLKSLNLGYDEIKDKAILFNYTKVDMIGNEINNSLSKQMTVYDYKKGDILSGILEDDNKYEIEIGYVTDNIPFGLDSISVPYVIISDDLYNKISTGKSSKVLEIMYKSSDPSKLQDDIDEVLKGEYYSLNNYEEDIRITNNFFTLVGIFLYGFIIVISLIGITNVFNTISTSVELRKQEFAMLKSVGMTSNEFNKMIRLENLFMGIKSLVWGVSLGIVLSYVMYIFLSDDSNISYKFPLGSILVSIIVVFLLISVIMRYSVNRINKQNTIETIRNENI